MGKGAGSGEGRKVVDQGKVGFGNWMGASEGRKMGKGERGACEDLILGEMHGRAGWYATVQISLSSTVGLSQELQVKDDFSRMGFQTVPSSYAY